MQPFKSRVWKTGHLILSCFETEDSDANASGQWLADIAEFFQLFNFKMKIFQILGHLCIVSDREFEKFSF